ncbi:MAG: alpha amylase C-terminal domain-containing protein [Chitinivibrionales bacterium]|nr:alpha amylase C-terminal domain-containing protein [Chitinivibrionales bacterium]
MVTIHVNVKTSYQRPGLHVWDSRKNLALAHLKPRSDEPKNGWWTFDLRLIHNNSIEMKLFEWNVTCTAESAWESDSHTRKLVFRPNKKLPEDLWITQSSSRIVQVDPVTAPPIDSIRVHCITHKRYRNATLYAWDPQNDSNRRYTPSGTDEDGPFYDIMVTGQQALNFKFISDEGVFEQDYANRMWALSDGAQIWTHNENGNIMVKKPVKKQLLLHCFSQWDTDTSWLHVWQQNSGFITDVSGIAGKQHDWTTFVVPALYTGIPYCIKMTANPQSTNPLDWEDCIEDRAVTIIDKSEYWTFEGDATLLNTKPVRSSTIEVEIVDTDPARAASAVTGIELRLNNSRHVLASDATMIKPDIWQFTTYPSVTTAFRFVRGDQLEQKPHKLKAPAAKNSMPIVKVKAVLERTPLLLNRPIKPLFVDPPFSIHRQGVVREDGFLRFILHAPWCSRVRLWTDLLSNESKSVEMQSTLDGTYWWAQLSVEELLQQSKKKDFHGARYRYILNESFPDDETTRLNGAKTVQDPAAEWVIDSLPSDYSRIVNHSRFQWHDQNWRTPGWDFHIIYQLHPRRFIQETSSSSLKRIAEEVKDGYIKSLGITTLELLPIADFKGSGWGYNPSYFYAVEESYGGPEALKALVDTCHSQGIACILDMVYNHYGCEDNIVWEVCRDTFMDGDTAWGRMVNFDNPQCKAFFENNLKFWKEEYHIDGFRFDCTEVIINGGHYDSYGLVRQPGSGGGWEFLHDLRKAIKSIDPNCILIAENLPNKWELTNYGGSMDSQWCDDYHDRIVDTCREYTDRMSQFAEALKYSQEKCQQWYNVVNYSESHDEVGNQNLRIAYVSHFGEGLRQSKVSAAATLLSRGVPMLFMGEEAAETEQFTAGDSRPINIKKYLTDENLKKVRQWWRTMIQLRKNNNRIAGPAPLDVHFVEDTVIAFSRGYSKDYFVVMNFGDNPRNTNLAHMNLPDGEYKELCNSTWPDYQVENEEEHSNGGWDAHLSRTSSINIPDHGVIVLERR